LGPVFAGFLIARLGNAPAFWLNGISFLAVIASLMVVRATQVRSASGSAKPLAQMAEAFRFWQTQPRLQDLFFFMLLNTFCYWSIVLNLLPAIASKVLGGDASTLGILQAASGAGAVTGLLVIVPLVTQVRRSGLLLVRAALWMGFWLFAFSLSSTIPASFVTLYLATWGAPVIFTMGMSLSQIMSPPEMRARLISLFTMVSFGMQPLAALMVGLLAERYGTQPVIQLNAAIITVGALAILVLRDDLRRWISVPPTPGSSTPVAAVADASGD
jgi:predicted MFS family arabinose efflux permease